MAARSHRPRSLSGFDPSDDLLEPGARGWSPSPAGPRRRLAAMDSTRTRSQREQSSRTGGHHHRPDALGGLKGEHDDDPYGPHRGYGVPWHGSWRQQPRTEGEAGESGNIGRVRTAHASMGQLRGNPAGLVLRRVSLGGHHARLPRCHPRWHRRSRALAQRDQTPNRGRAGPNPVCRGRNLAVSRDVSKLAG